VERKSNPRPQPNGREPESPERAALEALVQAVVGAAYEVSNVLGAGFLEKLYERALIEELRLRGIPVAAQATFPVANEGKQIGTYAADLVVDGRLLVEIKCADQLS
jgi:GxxExxY protein